MQEQKASPINLLLSLVISNLHHKKVHSSPEVFLFLYTVSTYFHYLCIEILIQVVHVSGNRSLLDYED